ncbi:AAA family ATPase [Marinimicrobium alkaliphilum]|uniref:AAA family ATPase n=1 Tax=Marinimicrobium alkaliphilum TaxID=2202654 RepID=UPI000DBABCDC|nr:AAA family ATPase [Marinimicrobium alkaliphilum]
MATESPYREASEPVDYRQYYGLAQDPFADDPEYPLFTGAGRRALMDQLLHLSQFSSSLLAVLGEPGTGKTRIARVFIESLPEEIDHCFITAWDGAEPEQIFTAIMETFGLAGPEPKGLGPMVAGLRRFSQSADELDNTALVIIDDAHHLDDKTLAALVSLFQGQQDGCLHLVLIGEPSLIQRLDSFNMPDVMIHDLVLEPMTLEEATDYLNFRIEMADYLGPEIFTEDGVEPWWRRAEGHLGRLHQQAHQWLLSSLQEPETPARKPLPVIHIIAVASLLTILALAFLYRSGDSDRASETLALEPVPEVLETPVEAPAPTPEPESAPAPDPLTDARPDAEIDPQVPALSPVPAPEPQAPPQAEAPSEPTVPAEPAPAPEPPPAPAPSAPQVTDDEQRLLSWRASDYTLQLLGASSESAVRDFIQRQPNRAQLLSFRTQRQGNPWYVVVTGRFSDADSARAAVANLPDAQRQAGPWARPLSGIQEEIERERGL